MTSGKLLQQDSGLTCCLSTALPYNFPQLPQDLFHRNVYIPCASVPEQPTQEVWCHDVLPLWHTVGIKGRCQDKCLVNQVQNHAHVGVLLPGLHTGYGFAPHRYSSTLLCSRLQGAATSTPGLEQLTNFLVCNLPAVIHTSGTVKKLGTSQQSLKHDQRGHGRGTKTAWSHTEGLPIYQSLPCHR